MLCKNCHTPLAPQSDYCHCCGGKVIRNRLTAKNLFQHFLESFFSYDNKLLRTVVFLFKDPRDVIDSYVKGVRNKYIAPLAFFTIAVTISGIYIFLVRKFYPEFMELMDDLHPDHARKEFVQKFYQFTLEYNTFLNFLMIPAAALLSKLVFYKNPYNFTEHLVVYFYTMSLFSIVSVLSTLILMMVYPSGILGFTSILYLFVFIYHCYVLKQLFKLNAKQLALKILLFIPVLFFIYIVMVILFLLLALWTGAVGMEDLTPRPPG